ncbi:hypothetical protein ABZS71_05525 [Streptomyces sp. NPDC005393]|uniref:hypothetical protein n=1 Tax=Streptomyces sp. NPDC005393 TaxID=3157041 RepID=UPI0033A53A54
MTTPTTSRKRGSSGTAKASARTGGRTAKPQSAQAKKTTTPAKTARKTAGKSTPAKKSPQGKKSPEEGKKSPEAKKPTTGDRATTARKGTTAKAAAAVKTTRSDGKRSVTFTVPTLDTVGHATKDTLGSVGEVTKGTLGNVGHVTGRAASGAVNAAMAPIAMARRVLPAKGGLPLYVGLGALGAAEVLEWPVAVGIGVGYAVLRKGGIMAPPSETRQAA